MPGKRPRPLQRTTSQSLLNFEAIGNQCSPLPEQHPVEKHKQGKGPVLCAHRQVIGFAAPTSFAEAEIVEKKAVSPGACQRPCGPHRSGLCDLFPRPCWKKENAPGIGLGIVAAMEKDDGAGEMKGIQMDCVGQYQQQAVYQPLFAPPPAPKASYPIPVSGLKQQLGFENVAVKLQAPPRSPRESYIGIMAPAGQGTVAQGGGGQAGTGASLLAWAQSTESILEEGSKLFTSLSSTPVSRSATGDSSGFTALQFLDACYFCKRRFGEDRDIYMYRGDKAFCSVECRHYQIVQDERLDKCSAAALSSGAITPARHNISQRNRVMAVAAGTAAAA